MDKLPPEARAFLDTAKYADDPSPADRVRADAAVREALARHGVHGLPAPDVGSASHVTVSALARTGRVVKLGITAAVATAAVFGIRALQSTDSAQRPASVSAPTVPAAPSASPPPASPPPARSIEHVDPPVPQDTYAEPSSATSRRPARSSHHPSRAAQPAAAGDDAALERELAVLAAVDDLIRRERFDEALALLERTDSGGAVHAVRVERTALRLLARCGSGAVSAVARSRDAFLASSPRSVLAERVRKACLEPRGTSP